MTRNRAAVLLLVAAAGGACGRSASKRDDQRDLTLGEATQGLPATGKLMADVATDLGVIRCQLFPDAAPQTVANFVGLARGLRAFRDPASPDGAWVKRPFYDGLAFHRVIPGFMIQGGDPLSRDYQNPEIGTGGPGYTIPDELNPSLNYGISGRLAMANNGPRTHSAGSQFFITDAPYPSLDGGWAIFGQCFPHEVVHAIAGVPRGAADRPDRPVRMTVKVYRAPD
jgi:peptidyl-prolyl cis-trans isomerase A (cyclophilin A)